MKHAQFGAAAGNFLWMSRMQFHRFLRVTGLAADGRLDLNIAELIFLKLALEGKREVRA
jgi:hypothetical protein